MNSSRRFWRSRFRRRCERSTQETNTRTNAAMTSQIASIEYAKKEASFGSAFQSNNATDHAVAASDPPLQKRRLGDSSCIRLLCGPRMTLPYVFWRNSPVALSRANVPWNVRIICNGVERHDRWMHITLRPNQYDALVILGLVDSGTRISLSNLVGTGELKHSKTHCTAFPSRQVAPMLRQISPRDQQYDSRQQ